MSASRTNDSNRLTNDRLGSIWQESSAKRKNFHRESA